MKMDNIGYEEDPLAGIENMPVIKPLFEELRCGLSNYWKIAESVLLQSGVKLKPPGDDDFFFKKNFFSFLFLYSFYRAGIPKTRRSLYATTLQCLRGMVTGCDNLLDDEYKMTLDSDIPGTAHRFRSVMDIMVSDRVLFRILTEACQNREIDLDQVMAATMASMKTMTRSGMQEATEEGGIQSILQPDEILRTVHHFKTGLLFTCPWDIPMVIENMDESEIEPLLNGLYRIGMGCQIMDDMVDFLSDLSQKRHNYMVSLIFFSPHAEERQHLQEILGAGEISRLSMNLAEEYPESVSKAFETSHQYLESGFARLFPEDLRFLVKPSIRFLEKRIGVDGLYRPQKDEN
jgi:hypothetical protein